MPDPPFKLPLKADEKTPQFIRDANRHTVIAAHGDSGAEAEVRAAYLVLCVNAHDRLVAVAKRFRATCREHSLIAEPSGRIVVGKYADDSREIDAALALAEPAGAEDRP